MVCLASPKSTDSFTFCALVKAKRISGRLKAHRHAPLSTVGLTSLMMWAGALASPKLTILPNEFVPYPVTGLRSIGGAYVLGIFTQPANANVIDKTKANGHEDLFT